MLDDIENGIQLTGLQKEIETQLEERRAMKRVSSKLIPEIAQTTKVTSNESGKYKDSFIQLMLFQTFTSLLSKHLSSL